jgi:hypothetical protein
VNGINDQKLTNTEGFPSAFILPEKASVAVYEPGCPRIANRLRLEPLRC